MSAGGRVEEIIVFGDKIYIDTFDGLEYCAIYVKRDEFSKQVQLEDIVWWHAAYAIWTPADRSVRDVKLVRVGYSGVSRPNLA